MKRIWIFWMLGLFAGVALMSFVNSLKLYNIYLDTFVVLLTGIIMISFVIIGWRGEWKE